MDEQGPRKFCENVFANFNAEAFFLRMVSGGDTSDFVLTPDHAKKVARLLSREVKKYEQTHGPLEGRLPDEPALSPLQMSKGDSDTK